MCTCHRDKKPSHSEACRRAHHRYNHTPKARRARDVLRATRRAEQEDHEAR